MLWSIILTVVICSQCISLIKWGINAAKWILQTCSFFITSYGHLTIVDQSTGFGKEKLTSALIRGLDSKPHFIEWCLGLVQLDVNVYRLDYNSHFWLFGHSTIAMLYNADWSAIAGKLRCRLTNQSVPGKIYWHAHTGVCLYVFCIPHAKIPSTFRKCHDSG